MTVSEFPRIAIVSTCPIRSDQSSGMLMRSLFGGLPQQCMSQVCLPLTTFQGPDADFCRQYRLIHLSGKVQKIDYGRQSHQARSWNDIRPMETLGAPTGSSAVVHKHLAGFVRGRRLKRWLRPCIEAWNILSPLGRVFERQLRDLRPDCVYALLGNFHLTKLTLAACDRLNLPLMIHVTDDYVTSLYRDVPFASTLQAASDKWFRRAVAYAGGLAAISPMMADEFASRYGKHWSWFTTLVDADVYNPAPRKADGLLRLVYAGNLGLGRWRVLRELALCLRRLCSELGIHVRLEILAPDEQLQAHRTALQVPPITELKGWARPEQLPHVFHNADVLVHVESFDPAFADYTKFSLSTKLSQYMMSGRCILGIGPSNLGSMRMIRTVGAGITIDGANAIMLRARLKQLLGDATAQRTCGARGRQWAMRWVERSTGQSRFRTELLRVVTRHDPKYHSVL